MLKRLIHEIVHFLIEDKFLFSLFSSFFFHSYHFVFFKKKYCCYFLFILAEISIFVFVRCFASPNSENGGGYMFFVCYHLVFVSSHIPFMLFSHFFPFPFFLFPFFPFPFFPFPFFSISDVKQFNIPKKIRVCNQF